MQPCSPLLLWFQMGAGARFPSPHSWSSKKQKVMEGIFFYSGFAMMLSFHRQNRMTGVGQQFQYILRDESTHLNFGVDLNNGLVAENPELWTAALKEKTVERIARAVKLEIAYAEDCLPRGALGLNAGQFRDYVQHIADRRLERFVALDGRGQPTQVPALSEKAERVVGLPR